MNLIRKQKLANDIVVIDGFSMSGKTISAILISHLERSEIWQLDSRYEPYGVLDYLKKIDRISAEALIQRMADKDIYEVSIGRFVNVRKNDVGGIYQNMLQERYLENIDKNEGNEVVENINIKKSILPLHIHFMLGFSDLFLKGFEDRLKLYIVTMRSPIEHVKNWMTLDFNNRIGKQPREFNITCDFNDQVIPWFTSEYAEEYINANDLEKAVLIVSKYYAQIYKEIENLNEEYRKKLLIIPFENIVENPEKYIDMMCMKLDTKPSKTINKILESNDLPREKPLIDILEINNLESKFNTTLKSDLKKDLVEVTKKYIQLLSEN